MSQDRRCLRRMALLGLVLALGLLAYFGLGGFNIGASQAPGALETRLAGWVRDASIRRRAPREATAATGAADLAIGLELFRSDCLLCHGAPGISPDTVGQGLNPPPPSLDGATTQARSDGELIWIISHGLRMTGMPAFGEVYGEPQLKQLAGFIRRLPRLTDEERARLQRSP